MKARKPAGDVSLPVAVERLRRQFPALTEDDLEAYATVTHRILSAPAPDRARITRETLARARAARPGEVRDDDARLALRYLAAVEKMQGRN